MMAAAAAATDAFMMAAAAAATNAFMFKAILRMIITSWGGAVPSSGEARAS
jgi:hypothetical protein